jgi:hypothetical protein
MGIPLSPKSKDNIAAPPPFCVCDIESANWTQFLTIGWYNGDDFFHFEDMSEFLDHCFLADEKILYAHFGGRFDFMFIIEATVKRKDLKIISMIPRGSGLLCFDVVKTEWEPIENRDNIELWAVYRRRYEQLSKELSKGALSNEQAQIKAANILRNEYKDVLFKLVEKKISFRDSSAILPFALRSLCESFDVAHKKLEIDYESITEVTPELLEYLEYDCRGHYEVIEAYQKWSLIQMAGPAYTMASQALKVFRTFLDKPIYSLKEDIDLFVRRSYFGGRTEIFKPLFEPTKRHKKIRCYDVNSLYPDVMRNNEFPTQFLYYTYNYTPGMMGFFEATVEVPKDMWVPPLPTVAEVEGYSLNDKGEYKKKKSKKLIFPTGRFSGVWSSIELEYARSLGVKILSVKKGAVFRSGGYIFKDYIDTLYKMRLDAKRKNDGVGDILTKLLMNSLYGRFGLNKDRTNLVFDEGQPGVDFHTEFVIEGNIVRLMTEKVELNRTFTNVAVPAWVTSLSRIKMHKLYMQCGKELYYTDTDSLFTTKKLKESNKLGDVKLEYEREMACFILPKTYITQDGKGNSYLTDALGKRVEPTKKLTMKGFDRKKIKNFDFEDFKCALEGDLRRLKVMHDAKFATFKSAIQRKQFVTMMPESPKQIRSLYDKRIVKKAGDKYSTEPICLA